MIRHTVTFKLKVEKGTQEATEFWIAAAALSKIPGVQNFEMFRQTSVAADLDYGLSMEFDCAGAHRAYNEHRDHLAFVSNFWGKSVGKFVELDYEPL